MDVATIEKKADNKFALQKILYDNPANLPLTHDYKRSFSCSEKKLC
jgi:hypothetical protein